MSAPITTRPSTTRGLGRRLWLVAVRLVPFFRSFPSSPSVCNPSWSASVVSCRPREDTTADSAGRQAPHSPSMCVLYVSLPEHAGIHADTGGRGHVEPCSYITSRPPLGHTRSFRHDRLHPQTYLHRQTRTLTRPHSPVLTDTMQPIRLPSLTREIELMEEEERSPSPRLDSEQPHPPHQRQQPPYQQQYQFQLHPAGVAGAADGSEAAAGSSAGASGRRSERWAKQNDWDAHRDIITGLYRDRGLTLKRVKETMEREYQFYST